MNPLNYASERFVVYSEKIWRLFRDRGICNFTDEEMKTRFQRNSKIKTEEGISWYVDERFPVIKG